MINEDVMNWLASFRAGREAAKRLPQPSSLPLEWQIVRLPAGVPKEAFPCVP